MSNQTEAPTLLQRWQALSTGLKMFVILSLGLLPLGIIAIAASMENARENRTRGEAEVRAMLAIQVQRFSVPLARHAITIRAARDAMAAVGDPASTCQRTLNRLAQLPATGGRYALFNENGQLQCVSPGFTVPRIPTAGGEPARPVLIADAAALRIFLYDSRGAIEGIMEFPQATLARLVNEPPLPGQFAVALVQGETRLRLRDGPPGAAPSSGTVAAQPLANGQYALEVRGASTPLTLSDILIIITPVLMWLWASAIGWLLVQRLLLRPLEQIQGAISAYRPGHNPLALPQVRSPAHEINALGQAFDGMTRTVSRHEADLEAGIARQTRLVREVHHRVKNNLQVVSSLLNIHSRGAADESAAAAYASIQRRVDALAVVHRNHYAELEETRGVALRPLVSELAANLRASAPVQARFMQIAVDIDPVHVSQDVAVSVAFLVTEIAELGMLCGASTIAIAVEHESGSSAELTIEADSLAGGPDCEPALLERFDRVITGLARQLRATLERPQERGRYAIRIPVNES